MKITLMNKIWNWHAFRIVMLAIILLASGAGAIPVEQWNKTFGGTGWNYALSVQRTLDGGYILAGYTNSYGAGLGDAWLIKSDTNGKERWNKTYGGTETDRADSVQQTTDGGYIIAGYTGSYGNGSHDAWLIKTDTNGNELWNKTFGGTGNDYASSVRQTADGYIIAGRTFSYGYTGSGTAQAWLIKTDLNGNEKWNKTFGKVWDIVSVQQTFDGYILAGGDLLIKTDVNGNEQWNKTYGGTGLNFVRSGGQTLDGGYILAGYTTSYGAGLADAWLIKTDMNGNEQWNKTYGGTGTDVASSVQQTLDGGYILAGYTTSYGAGSADAWLIKTDMNGNEQWNKTFGGPIWDEASSIQQAFDGSYIIAGRKGLYAWLIKVFDSANLVQNPGFEDWGIVPVFPAYWDVGTKWEAPNEGFPNGDPKAVTRTTVAHSGNYAIRFTYPGNWIPPGPPGSGYSIIKQDIHGIIPGATYNFSFWGKLPTYSGGNRAYVWWINSSGYPLEFPNHAPAIAIVLDPGMPFNYYKKFEGVTPPAPFGAVAAQIQFGRYGWNPMHIDDVYFGIQTLPVPSVHNLDTKENFFTIQAAIDNVHTLNGHTILVDSGTYYENVNVRKQLILRGNDTGRGKPVVDGMGSGSVLTLSAGNSTLEGFTVINGNSDFGGIILSSNNNIISDNNISNNSACGIWIHGAANNTIKTNRVLNNDAGICFMGASKNLIYNNYFNNTYNNAYENLPNTWNITKTSGTNIINGTYLGGNYWSDYSGVDTDGDGLGNTLLPYNSSGSIIDGDYLPLTLPAENLLFVTANPMSVKVSTPTNVIFKVTSYGIPVSNASVNLSGAGVNANGITNSTGQVVITVHALSSGSINVVASKTNYKNGTSIIVATPGIPGYLRVVANLQSVKVSTPAKVTFRVTNLLTSAPIDNATINLSGAGVLANGTTNSTGYTIINVHALSSGLIRVAASKSGFNNATAYLFAR